MINYETYRYRFIDLKENKGIKEVEIILHNDDEMTIEYSGKNGFNKEAAEESEETINFGLYIELKK